jgi:Tfp pilus assembly protein FimT
MPKGKGLSLIDLLIAISISVLLLGLGLPDFRQFMSKHDADTTTRQIFRSLQKARELAVLSGNGMLFCGVDAEQKCVSDDITRFVIFFDQNKNGQVDGEEAVESELELNYRGRISVNIPRNYFRYFNNGETRPSGSIFLCPQSGDSKFIRRISTNFSGRPYIARPNADGIVVNVDRSPIDCDA